MNMHWKLNKLSPKYRNDIWQDELYQLVSSGHVWSRSKGHVRDNQTPLINL